MTFEWLSLWIPYFLLQNARLEYRIKILIRALEEAEAKANQK
jgi:hypothetical protein